MISKILFVAAIVTGLLGAVLAYAAESHMATFPISAMEASVGGVSAAIMLWCLAVVFRSQQTNLRRIADQEGDNHE